MYCGNRLMLQVGIRSDTDQLKTSRYSAFPIADPIIGAPLAMTTTNHEVQLAQAVEEEYS